MLSHNWRLDRGTGRPRRAMAFIPWPRTRYGAVTRNDIAPRSFNARFPDIKHCALSKREYSTKFKGLSRAAAYV